MAARSVSEGAGRLLQKYVLSTGLQRERRRLKYQTLIDSPLMREENCKGIARLCCAINDRPCALARLCQLHTSDNCCSQRAYVWRQVIKICVASTAIVQLLAAQYLHL
jgi:hypothetical protein